MKAVRLKDVAWFNKRTLEDSTDPGFSFKYIDISAVTEGSVAIPEAQVRFADAPSRARRLAGTGDVLISTVRTYLRAVAAVPAAEDPLVFSTGFAVLSPKGNVDQRFLAYACLSQPVIQEVEARSVGVSYPAVNASDVADVRVPLPPLEEQRRIADFLDAEISRIDRMVDIRSRQAIVLEEAADCMTRMAVSGLLCTASAVESGVIWIGWVHPDADLVALGRIVHLQRGVDLTDAERVPGTVDVVTTAGVVGTHNRAIESGPGVVVGRYGSAGSVHWVEGKYWPHNTTLYVKNFRGNDPEYCYYLLKSYPYSMEHARSAVPGLNRNDLHRRLMPRLPVDLQREAVRILNGKLSRFSAARGALLRSNDLLIERRRALITAAVTGQLDVTTARSGVRVS